MSRLCRLFVLLSVLWSAHAFSVNTNPQFEFGTIAAEDCIVTGPSVSCTFNFSNTYSSPPLVFVMSTIDASRSNFDTKTTEYPSDLRVMSVSESQTTVTQLIPNHDAACETLRWQGNRWRCGGNGDDPVTYVDAPMENIDYFVMEPGVLEFSSGAKLVAGLVSYNRTYSNAGGGGNSRLTVNYSSYGLTSNFDSNPGVLVQIQSINNIDSSTSQPLWLTPIALNPSRSNFSLILDRSEVTSNAVLPVSEQVAFVAGLGEGFVDGRKFWLGQGATRSTLNINDQVIKPVTEGCQQESTFTVSGFSNVPTLLASKRTRNGNNGGWLRRCSVSKTGVSLINDEDMARDSERAHVVEPYSYFLFDKPPLNEVCQLFPSPAQTWKNNTTATLRLDNATQISGAQLSNGRRFVGFAQNTITGNNATSACDGGQCYGDTGLQVEKQELESFQAPDSGLENVNVWQDNIQFSNNEAIGRMTVGRGSVTFYSGTYWIDSIDVNNDGQIIVPEGEKVTIHIKNLNLNTGAFFGEQGEAQLIVLVHDLSGAAVNLSNNSELAGLLYSEVTVRMSDLSIVRGAVTAQSILMSNDTQIIATDNHCFQPADDYTIDLTPLTDISLICEDITLTATVYNGDNVDTTFNGAVSFYRGNELLGSANAANGVASYLLSATQSQVFDNLYAQATLGGSAVQSETSGEYRFVPFRFDANDQFMVASKPSEISATVLACNDGSVVADTAYSGTPQITSNLIQPSSGTGTLTYTPQFTGGQSNDPLLFSESGQLNVTLTDSNYDCTGFDGCPIDGGGELTGAFLVNARPWTFAICGALKSGTASGGDSFVAAGERFELDVRPIRWQGTNETGEIETSSYCSDAAVTSNFYASDAPTAVVQLSSALHTPVDGTSTALLASDSGLESDHDAANPIRFSDLYWDDVGSLTIKANTQAPYLTMNIDTGYRHVGRFYPKYFKVAETPLTDWRYPSGQSFVYMNQPLDSVTFYVEALNANQERVNNYIANGYAASLRANFALYESNATYTTRFSSPLPTKSWGVGGQSVGEFVVSSSSSDVCITELCWQKAETTVGYEDGPFNSGGSALSTAISITTVGVTNTDPIDYLPGSVDATLLTLQPDIRFGRAVLTGTGGTMTDDLVTPLRVEYWNGSQFVTNDEDSSTHVYGVNDSSANYHLWVEDGKTPGDVVLEEDGTLQSGRTMKLEADNPSDVRQQTQIWLDLDAGGNALPWLTYRWADDRRADEANGEEDPSTVVTFGIFRGSDRVIFRGEPGLTGQ
ncbi:hypothetical protein H4F17_05945 [Vibrio cholerae]